jgi:hypothetical protein
VQPGDPDLAEAAPDPTLTRLDRREPQAERTSAPAFVG